MRISLSNQLQAGDIYLRTAVGAQSVSGPVDLPVFLANVSWYYRKAVFGRALILQTGIDAWYCSNYDPFIYNIVNGQFNVGHYADWDYPFTYAPVLDVYASFDVRTLRFFAKLENAAQGLYQKGYYEAPFYPCQPRSFKLGFNWMLFY
ncbi:MAG: putative porin [Chitinophagales bacterium]